MSSNGIAWPGIRLGIGPGYGGRAGPCMDCLGKQRGGNRTRGEMRAKGELQRGTRF